MLTELYKADRIIKPESGFTNFEKCILRQRAHYIGRIRYHSGIMKAQVRQPENVPSHWFSEIEIHFKWKSAFQPSVRLKCKHCDSEFISRFLLGEFCNRRMRQEQETWCRCIQQIEFNLLLSLQRARLLYQRLSLGCIKWNKEWFKVSKC